MPVQRQREELCTRQQLPIYWVCASPAEHKDAVETCAKTQLMVTNSNTLPYEPPGAAGFPTSFCQDLTSTALSACLEGHRTKHGRAPFTHIQPKPLIFSAARQITCSSSGSPFCSASSGLASCLPTQNSWLHPGSHTS